MQSALRVAVSFLVGLAAFAAAWAIYYLAANAPGPMSASAVQTAVGIFVTIVLTGLLLGWPIALAACLVVMALDERIRQHSVLFCGLAPVVAAIGFAGVDYFAHNNSSMGAMEFFLLPSVVWRIGAALAVAAIASLVFYAWSSLVRPVVSRQGKRR